MADPGFVDPYAVNKANLRDTIKWLATIFGALAAAVLAGTPVSGIGALWPSAEFAVAGCALIAAFLLVCAALVITVRLLRADVLYASELDPSQPIPSGTSGREIVAIRRDIQTHAIDLLPPEYKTLESFLAALKRLLSDAEHVEKRIGELAKSSPGGAESAALKAQLATLVSEITDFRGYQQRILAYASYQRFYERLVHSTKWLFAAGIGALISLMMVAVVIHHQASSKPATAPAGSASCASH